MPEPMKDDIARKLSVRRTMVRALVTAVIVVCAIALFFDMLEHEAAVFGAVISYLLLIYQEALWARESRVIRGGRAQ